MDDCQVCGNPENEHPVYLGYDTETEVDIFCEKDKTCLPEDYDKDCYNCQKKDKLRKPSGVRK